MIRIPASNSAIAALVAAVVALAAGVANADPAAPHAPRTPMPPTVTVTGAASASVPTDRLQAWLRAEVDNADPATAASAVNSAMAKALTRIKGVPAVKPTTSGYSTQQITEKGKPARWRVAQSLTLDSGDFAAMATLVGKLQDDDGLLVSGMSFSLSSEARRRAEETLTQEAIRSWQERTQRAAQGLGFAQWRPGHVTVQTGDIARPFPVMRAQSAMLGAAPVPLEPGSVDVTVTVTGDAILGDPVPPR
jgi:predicted secreted protein